MKQKLQYNVGEDGIVTSFQMLTTDEQVVNVTVEKEEFQNWPRRSWTGRWTWLKRAVVAQPADVSLVYSFVNNDEAKRARSAIQGSKQRTDPTLSAGLNGYKLETRWWDNKVGVYKYMPEEDNDQR